MADERQGQSAYADTSVARTNDSFAWTGRANVSRTYAPNGLNQYGAVGGTAYCYDANGNLTYDGTSVYRYDMENRLVEKRAAQGSTCPTTTSGYGGALIASLRYDPSGRLYETVGATTGTTRFLHDGDNLVAEYDGGGNLLARYAHGANASADDPLFWFAGATTSWPTQRQLVADHQGSIVAVGLNDGTNLAINSYDEYGLPYCPLVGGMPDCSAAGANQGRFQYTGQAWIPELKMYYYKARIYSPILGRFMQTDPIGYKDQVNLYAYVGNDPLNHTDPTGLETGTFSNGCQGDGTGCDPGGKVHQEAAKVLLTVASLFVGPELLGIRFGAAATVRVGSALFKAGEAASTRLAQAAIGKAANATLSGLAKGEGRVMAGSGSKTVLREGENLAKQFGGAASDYQKVSSRTIAETSNGAKVEVHAYRNVETGKIYYPKLKVQGGGP